MPRPKRVGPPAYEPTVQFRPVPRLSSQLVRPLAEREGLGLNEAYKNLAALSAVGLDARYYPLINQLALATGGTNAFTQACLRVHDAFGVAGVNRTEFQDDRERSEFVLRVVRTAVEGAGRELPDLDLWFQRRQEVSPEVAPEMESSQPTRDPRKRQRTIRHTVDENE